MLDNELIVYWSPSLPMWNILYEDPVNCYVDLISNVNKDSKKNNFFACPSFKDLTKNIFYITNPIESHFFIDENMNIIPKSKNYVNSKIAHKPSMNNNILFDYGISHYFFCEEDLEVTKTSPYFHNVNYEKYGKMVPGKWNCGAWIRPINNEINLWNDIKEIKIEKNEILCYYHFNTNKKIKLKRFVPSQTICDIADACGLSSVWDKGNPLSNKYKRFKKSKTNKIILDEIKKNLVD